MLVPFIPPTPAPPLPLPPGGGLRLIAATTDFGVNVLGGSNNLPGTSEISSLASGIGFWALIAAVIGIIVGGLLWAFGSYSQNYQQALNGRRGVLISGVAALLVGAGPHIVSFFFNQGGGVTM